MEKDLYSFTFCRSDWERVMGALRATAVTNYNEANKVGLESTYGGTLYEEGSYSQALAEEIDFFIPE